MVLRLLFMFAADIPQEHDDGGDRPFAAAPSCAYTPTAAETREPSPDTSRGARLKPNPTRLQNEEDTTARPPMQTQQQCKSFQQFPQQYRHRGGPLWGAPLGGLRMRGQFVRGPS